MSERDPFGWFAVIVAMTVAVYITRAGGYWLIGRLHISPSMLKILDALPGAVIAATIAPLLTHGGTSGLIAVVTALLVMIAVRRDFAAVAAGVAAAALARAAGL